MIQSRNDKANLNEFEAILFLNFRMHCLLCSMFWHEHCHFFISFFPSWRIFDGKKKMVSQKSPTSSCWALIVTGKEANFFPFHCKFLHELNQLSNKKTLPWGRREKKELILLWSWEVEDEQENKVQRKTTFEIWLLFQRICGLDKKKEADLFEEKNLRSTFRNCCWACDVCLKVKGYICWVVVDGIFSLERRKSSMLLILFSFFEVKIRPHSAWKFCVDFSQSVSSVSVHVSKTFVSFSTD